MAAVSTGTIQSRRQRLLNTGRTLQENVVNNVQRIANLASEEEVHEVTVDPAEEQRAIAQSQFPADEAEYQPARVIRKKKGVSSIFSRVLTFLKIAFPVLLLIFAVWRTADTINLQQSNIDVGNMTGVDVDSFVSVISGWFPLPSGVLPASQNQSFSTNVVLASITMTQLPEDASVLERFLSQLPSTEGIMTVVFITGYLGKKTLVKVRALQKKYRLKTQKAKVQSMELQDKCSQSNTNKPTNDQV